MDKEATLRPIPAGKSCPVDPVTGDPIDTHVQHFRLEALVTSEVSEDNPSEDDSSEDDFSEDEE